MTTVFLHEFVTGGGLAGTPLPTKLTSEGGAMRRALAGDFAAVPGVRVLMTLDEQLPDEPGPWETVRVGPGGELATFGRLAAEADYTLLIAPETGNLLRDRARLIEKVGGRSLGATPEAIAWATDKARMGDDLIRWGIPTPPCRRVDRARGLPEDFPYPAVLKPNDGAGSVDTYYIGRAGPFPAGAEAMIDPILQPFVTGLPMSVSVLNEPNGTGRVLGVSRQRIAREGGAFTYRGGVFEGRSQDGQDRTIREITRRIPGLLGFFGVDYFWNPDSGEVVVLEVNPRPTTSYAGLARYFVPGAAAWAWLAAIDPARWEVVGRDSGFRGEDGALRVASAVPVAFDAAGAVDA